MRTAILVGDHPLLVSCASALQGAGFALVAVSSSDASVAGWAVGQGISTITFAEIGRSPDTSADVLLSVGNLRVIAAEVLAAFDVAVNFHDGPLPELAGLHAPMWAILGGRAEHGITWHVMDPEVDGGNILAERRFPVAADATTRSLNIDCFEAGQAAFDEVVEQLTAPELSGQVQTRGHDEYHGRWDRPLPANVVDPRHVGAAEFDRIVRALDFGPTINRVGRPMLALGNGAVFVIERATPESGATLAPATFGPVVVDGNAAVITSIGTRDGDVSVVGRIVTQRGRRAPEPGALAGQSAVAIDAVALQAAHDAVVRNESAWAAALAEVRPIDLGAAQPESRPGAVRSGADAMLTTPLTADQIVAHLGVYLLARSGQAEGTADIALTAPAEASAVAFATIGPCNFAPEPGATVGAAVAAALSAINEVQSRNTHTLELASRMPRQADPASSGPEATAVVVDNGDAAALSTAELVVTLDVEAGRVTFAAFDGALAERLAAGFVVFVDAAAATPDSRLDSITPQGVSEALQTAVATQPLDPEPPARTLHGAFLAAAAANPDGEAIAYRSKTWTYAELEQYARVVAAELIAGGVAPGHRVGLAASPSCEAIGAILGIFLAGAAYVPLDPRFPADRLRYMIADSGLQVALVDSDELRATVDTCIDLAAIDIAGPGLAGLATTDDPESLAYVMYTSGSTGQPKGVMVSHGNVTSFLAAMEPIVGTENGVWLSVTTLSFDISVLELFHPLVHGWKVVLYEGLGAAMAAPTPATTSGPGVDLSLFFFGTGEDSDYQLLLDTARFGDREGFAAVWTPERHFHAFGGPFPNPSVTSAAIAAVTERIGIRAGSCVLPLHHPVRVAEEWAVVDNISRGRVGLSIAAGWHPDDFLLRPQNFRISKPALADEIDTLRALWRGESQTFEGPEGPVDVVTLPRPVQAELPIWYTTAGNPDSFAFAGRNGLNILTHLLGQSIAQVEANVDRYREAWREAGHAGDGHVVLMLHTYVGTDRSSVKEIVREPMKAYLRDSVGLLRDVASSFPTFDQNASTDDALAALTAEDLDALLDAAFERYFDGSGLFGSIDDAAALATEVAAAGIDEIACLMDFGVDMDLVRDSFPRLASLRELLAADPAMDDSHAGGEPDTYGSLIERHQVTHFQCTPSEANIVLADPGSRDALGRLSHMLVGGEAFPTALASELLDLVGGELVNMYGPTETTIWSTAHHVTSADIDAGSIPIGQPLANTIVAVVDDALTPRPLGYTGELLLGGGGVTQGYHGQRERTNERFVTLDGRRMYRTGDVASRMPGKPLGFHGRIDSQVKIRGHRVELGEIETALGRQPGVEQAVVTFDPSLDNPVLEAHVVPTALAGQGPAMLSALAIDLPAHMVPAMVRGWEAFPMTPNGKVDRMAMAAAPAATSPAQVPSAPAPIVASPASPSGAALDVSSARDAIVEAWKAVLAVDNIDPNRTFFDHGGNSLQIVSVRQQLEASLAIKVSLVDLFRYPTIEALAPALSGALGSGTNGVAQASGAPLVAVAPIDAHDDGAGRGARRAAARRGARRR